MKKALTFLLIFCPIFYPPQNGHSQDSTAVTKADARVLNLKDSVISAKIDSQLITAKQEVKRIENKKTERIVLFRTRIKNHVRTDSFYVYLDTCFGNNVITTIPDTVWMERNKPRLKEFFKNLFHKKKNREIHNQKDEKKAWPVKNRLLGISCPTPFNQHAMAHLVFSCRVVFLVTKTFT